MKAAAVSCIQGNYIRRLNQGVLHLDNIANSSRLRSIVHRLHTLRIELLSFERAAQLLAIATEIHIMVEVALILLGR